MGGSRVRPKRKPEPTPVEPQPVRPTAAILPRGPVEMPTPNGQSFGAQWENLHPHYDLIAREATPRGLPIPLVVAVGLIESGWNQTWPSGPNRGKVIEVHDSYGGGPSVGFMQVKPHYWQSLIPTADAYTIAGNVALGCELLTRKIKERGSWQEAIKRDYHPGVSPNGTTPEGYVRCITALMAEWDQKTQDDAPKPPAPQPATDPMLVIAGGVPFDDDYGWLADAGLNYYAYGVNHGTQRPTQHPGVDLALSCGAALYAPAPGLVDCVGTRGTPRWGQNCGAYADVDGGGVGNITILLDGNIKLTLGHCRQAFVNPGDRVTAGQKVATVGSMNGCHAHVETSVERGGTYWLVEPRATLRSVMTPKPPTPPKPEPTAPLVFGRVPHPPYQDRLVDNSGAWNDLGPRTIVGTCLHSMVGTLTGTDSYFRNEARLTALTDYGVGGATDGALDGVIYRWNDPKGRRAPYANGGNGPEGDGPAFIRRYGVSAINRDLVSIERSDGGSVNTTVSPKQFEAIARLMAYWHDQAKVPWNAFPINPAGGVVTQLQHYEFSEKACPFPPVRSITTRYQDRVRAILREYQTGAGPQPPTPNPDPVAPSDGYPRGMDAELAKTLFGAFARKMPDGSTQRYGFDPSPKGVASAAWLARGDEEDEFPEARQWIDQLGGGVVLTFSNGWSLRYDPGNKGRPWFWVGDETP